jgi:hypothetical protein
VRVADEQDLDVGEAESELLDARAQERHGLDEVAVDEDVALGRGDEVARQPLAADVVEVAGNAERRKRLRPIRRTLRACPAGDDDDGDAQGTERSFCPHEA